MFIESQLITDPKAIFDDADDFVALYCGIEDMSHHGGHVSGAFLHCIFKNLDLYWGMFNLVSFVSCKFEQCVFRGTSFPDCRFVECAFKDCLFLRDNLNAPCKFEGAKWYDCTQNRCEGLII